MLDGMIKGYRGVIHYQSFLHIVKGIQVFGM